MNELSPALLDLAFGYDRDLPLEAERKVLREGESLRIERFEVTSRYDQRVAGLLLADPRAEGARPLALLAHPGTLDKGSDYVLWPAQQLVERGFACVTIDQAGHGERARREVTMEDFRSWPRRRLDQTLQTAVDWMRALDWAVGLEEADGERVGFAGFSMGGMRGAAFVGMDQRVRAASFCIAGAGSGGEGALALGDPAAFAPMMAGRAVQVVAGERDDVVTPEAARRFYEGLGEPREIVWLPCGHWDFPPAGFEPPVEFLTRMLG